MRIKSKILTLECVDHIYFYFLKLLIRKCNLKLEYTSKTNILIEGQYR